mmetsp:Transcript_98420/g.234319  ORF Transcript_98420/g.234319 Transcript_98420/m.234319 type:complete len:110 (-) Transcript_98420:744-1073(-)
MACSVADGCLPQQKRSIPSALPAFGSTRFCKEESRTLTSFRIYPASEAPAIIKDLLRATGGSGIEDWRWRFALAAAADSFEEARLTSRLTFVDATVDVLPALMLLDMRR